MNLVEREKNVVRVKEKWLIDEEKELKGRFVFKLKAEWYAGIIYGFFNRKVIYCLIIFINNYKITKLFYNINYNFLKLITYSLILGLLFIFTKSSQSQL